MEYKAQENGDEILQNRKVILEESGIARPGYERKMLPAKKRKGSLESHHPFSLKKIKQDERRWKEIKSLTIFEYLGKPPVKNPLKIPDKEIPAALENLLSLCNGKGISLVVRGYYPPKEIYRFMVNELFQWRTEEILQPDCICKLIYEDYHPNHKINIEDVATRFLELWLGRKLSEFNFELSDIFVTGKGQIRTKFDVLSCMRAAFEEIIHISNASMYYSQVSYNWDEEEKTGTGHAEGMIKYVATLKDGQTQVMEGPFKFYLTNENNGWEVFYFVLPGYSW